MRVSLFRSKASLSACSVRLPARERFRSPQRTINFEMRWGQRTLHQRPPTIAVVVRLPARERVLSGIISLGQHT